jgi:Mrp family chromosome partitioning ATPase
MRKILICSGKGGVGKTTISVAIANELSRRGRLVALVDADIDTPNIPEFTEIDQKVGTGEKIKPIVVGNLEVMSLGLIIDDNDFVSWSGEKRGMAVQQLVEAVDWNSEMEFMVIDSAPGTSDEIQYIVNAFHPDNVFVISTPHPASIADVKRTISMLNKNESVIDGIIMNMAKIVCPGCGKVIQSLDVPSEISDISVIQSIEFSIDGIDVSKLCDLILDGGDK